MERNQFCSLLEEEYRVAREQWAQTLQDFGPPAQVWEWLHSGQVQHHLQDHQRFIIKYLIEIYLHKFNLLKQRLDQLSAKKNQLRLAIFTLGSHQPYYHLSHFNEGDYIQYYTDGIEPSLDEWDY